MGMADNALPASPTPPPQAASGTLNVRILRANADAQVAKDDRVAVEAPLEFLLHHPALGLGRCHSAPPCEPRAKMSRWLPVCCMARAS